MQNYNLGQKWFHDFVLRSYFINKSLFELEKIIYLNEKDIKNISHIFITSLPRSGTTSLLNFLYETEQFGSLKYLNMPFILSPHFSRLFNKKNIVKKERLHNDGIKYDLKSPEAFDEYFFNNDKRFVKDELFNFLNLVLSAERKERYLSKNNLNYKRIGLIKSLLPNSIFLIPIREPIQHAFSLLNQHLQFKKLQKKDDFIRRYMNYLGHNEFGLNHIPWNKPINFSSANNINYWLEQWILFFENTLKIQRSFEKCFFVTYENLPNKEYLKKLLSVLNFEKENKVDLNYFKNFNKNKIDIEYDEPTLKRAISLYKNISINYSL